MGKDFGSAMTGVIIPYRENMSALEETILIIEEFPIFVLYTTQRLMIRYTYDIVDCTSSLWGIELIM